MGVRYSKLKANAIYSNTPPWYSKGAVVSEAVPFLTDAVAQVRSAGRVTLLIIKRVTRPGLKVL